MTDAVLQVIATDKQQVVTTTEIVSTIVSVGEQGPRGPIGEVGGYGFAINTLQAGDHLEFAGTQWVNVAKQTLSDGGNF